MTDKGLTQQFKAIGTFEKGSELDLTDLVTWKSSDSKVASIGNSNDDRGLITPLSVGSSKISATYNSIHSNSIDFEVTPEILASIKTKP